MNRLTAKIDQIKSYQTPHLELCKELWEAYESKIYPLDFLANAVLKRSLSLIHGYCTLMEAKNFTCSTALLRLQLDNCLRFHAAWLVDNPHEFASKVLKGVPIKKQKDRKGKPMTDRYLVESLSAQYPWVKRVYEETSGFIHLSEKHIFMTFTDIDKESREIAFTISNIDDHVAESFYYESACAFCSVIEVLFEYLYGWLKTKSNPDIIKNAKSCASNN